MTRYTGRSHFTTRTQALIAMVMAVLLVVSAAAAPDRFTGRTSYLTAAGWSDSGYIHVNSSRDGTNGYLGIYDGNRWWDGSFYASPDALSMATNLSSAELAPTKAQLQSYAGEECYYSEWDEYYCYSIYDYQEVTVSAIFDGIDKVQRLSERDKFNGGDCSYSFSGKTSARNATGSLTAAELNVTSTMNSGYIVMSQLSYRSQCK